MPVNLDKPQQWKADIVQSVDMYNKWFMKFAPQAFRDTRTRTTKDVEAALHSTSNITNIQPAVLEGASRNLTDAPNVDLPTTCSRQTNRPGRSVPDCCQNH